MLAQALGAADVLGLSATMVSTVDIALACPPCVFAETVPQNKSKQIA